MVEKLYQNDENVFFFLFK